MATISHLYQFSVFIQNWHQTISAISIHRIRHLTHLTNFNQYLFACWTIYQWITFEQHNLSVGHNPWLTVTSWILSNPVQVCRILVVWHIVVGARAITLTEYIKLTNYLFIIMINKTNTILYRNQLLEDIYCQKYKDHKTQIIDGKYNINIHNNNTQEH